MGKRHVILMRGSLSPAGLGRRHVTGGDCEIHVKRERNRVAIECWSGTVMEWQVNKLSNKIIIKKKVDEQSAWDVFQCSLS